MEGELGIIPGTTGQVDPSSAYPIAGDAGIAFGQGTGQQGITPVTDGGIVGGVEHAFQGLWHWLQTPFTQRMSPINVFLLVGIVIVAVLVWNLILYHIRIAGEAV